MTVNTFLADQRPKSSDDGAFTVTALTTAFVDDDDEDDELELDDDELDEDEEPELTAAASRRVRACSRRSRLRST